MSYQLKDSERTVGAMVYSPMRMIWGNLVHPEPIQPQVWLKHTAAPEFLHFIDAQIVVFGGRKPARASMTEIHIPLSEVLAFHLLPAEESVPDYDPTEPNRAMKEVVVSCSIFRFEGLVRVATIADFGASIEGFRDLYRPFYAVSVSHPTAVEFEPMVVPYVLIRTDHIVYMVPE